MNGKPDDDPLIDILVHNLTVFSAQADELIKEILNLGGRDILERRFNLFSPPPLAKFEVELRQLRDELKAEARLRGWEVD
jgi:hypothetical protein